MTLEEFLTLPLPERIKWLRSEDGPRGKLSHDKFAAALDTKATRQIVIGWENGAEPQARYANKLAEFSGFPAFAFRRREAEAAAAASTPQRLQAHDLRLEALEGRAARLEEEGRNFGDAVVARLGVIEAALGIEAPALVPPGSGVGDPP